MLKLNISKFVSLLTVALTPLFADQIKVSGIEGNVYLKSSDTQINLLKKAKSLELPQTFNTGPGSMVIVQVDPVTTLEVGESSKIKIEKLASGEWFIDLSMGSVRIKGVQLDSSLKPTFLSLSTSTLSSDVQCFDCGLETNGYNTLAWNISGKMKIKHIFFNIERTLMHTEAAIQKPNGFEEYDYKDSIKINSALIGLKERYLRLDYVSLSDSLAKEKIEELNSALTTLPAHRNQKQKLLIQELKFRTLSETIQ
ncbi:hypothetical protein OAA91_00680 [Fibrobacterales bacterium]|nr:hypothetical protein [Fibrobacterales bacterium]